MPSYHNATLTEEKYQALSTLPLPEAAVVIDVRQNTVSQRPLLTFLHTEIEDLSNELRQHRIHRWSQLADCIRFLKVEVVSLSNRLDELTDFVVTQPAARPLPLLGWPNLIAYLGHTCIDEVRVHRKQAMMTFTSMPEKELSDLPAIRPTTVRVFFLTDMDEHDTLICAATYAQGLKEWCEQTHGNQRFDRNERIQTIILCLNTDTARSQEILLQTLGTVPSTAIDTLILLQNYSDDETPVTDDEQNYHADLLVYSLLLHWPAVFIRTVEDPLEAHAHFAQATRLFPWPTYTIGIAAMEYSVRWTTRWLDYGVSKQLLAVINDAEKVEREEPLLKQRMQIWLQHWWQEMQQTIPDSMSMEIPELQALVHIDAATHPAQFRNSTPRTIDHTLETFSRQVSAFYHENNDDTLQYTLKNGPAALLEQLTRVSKYGFSSQQKSEEATPYVQLAALYLSAKQFIPVHFQEAWGALPRALRQLAALAEPIASISALASNPPDLKSAQGQLERQVDQERTTLSKKYALWQLPLIGSILRSTVLCWLLVIVLALLLLIGVNWQSLFTLLPIGSEWRYNMGQVQLIWKGLLILLLLGGTWLYLAQQKKAFRLECLYIHRKLCQLVTTHTTQVKSVIAARLALTLLQQANLYQPGTQFSPYEQRLQKLAEALKETQEQANNLHEQAHMRLDYLADRQHSASSAPALVLHNRIELIYWKQIEDALLHAHKELHSDSAIFNLLAEMLLRRLGAERPTEILNDMLNAHRWLSGESSKMRFQALETLFSVLALVLPIMPSKPIDLLPLLQQYSQLQELYQQEPAIGTTINDIALLVRESMLEQPRIRQLAYTPTRKQPLALRALASWVSTQRNSLPGLAELFASNAVLDHLENITMQPSQVIDTLSRQGTLLGYPDEISGEDFYYLFFAPGTTSTAFLKACQSLQHTPIHLAPFPEQEKLIYLHIHRIRQLLPATASTASRIPTHNQED